MPDAEIVYPDALCTYQAIGPMHCKRCTYSPRWHMTNADMAAHLTKRKWKTVVQIEREKTAVKEPTLPRTLTPAPPGWKD